MVRNVLVHENRQIEIYNMYIYVRAHDNQADIQVIEISTKVTKAYKRVFSFFTSSFSVFFFSFSISIRRITRRQYFSI